MDTLRRIPYWTVLALLIYMPFHIFLSQSLSLATGGLEAWKIAKDIVLVLATVFTICLVWITGVGQRSFYILALLAAVYFGLHLAVWGLHPDIYQKSALLGVVYNVRLPALLLLGYGASLVYPGKFALRSVVRVVLAVSSVVALLGVAQFLLPKDILTHLGYSMDRGVRPAFFIDDKAGLPRIMSTLREPNALGAYLLVPLAALFVLILKAARAVRRWQFGGLFALHALALFLTFSRSAWLGAAVALSLVVWWRYSSLFVRFFARWWPALAIGLVLLLALGVLQRDNQFVRSYITHNTPEQVQDLDSNDYHWIFLRQGVEGIVQQPIGHGPGTAGIVSIQNPKGSFLTENYYVQIGYEVGVAGLGIFIALSVLVYQRLYRRHDDVAVVLLAGFWAYVVTNMLLHTWSNEAVAAQWWLLAGLALTTSAAVTKRRA